MQSMINKMKDLNFDSSLSSIDDVVSDSDYRESLVSLLQPILDQRFTENLEKQRIVVHRDRISFACPYCGDSMRTDHKKRGNFILLGKHAHHFKCFNCGTFKRTDKFFEDYHINLDLSIVNYIANGIVDFSNYSNIKYDMSMFLDLESVDNYGIDRQEFLNYFNLQEVKNSSIWSYLVNRMQYDATKFMYNPRLNHLIILNLTYSGKILGLQKRVFKGYNKYLTYTLKKIYELMKKNSEEIPDEINMLSQLFNICLIDYSKSVTLFEGPLDSFLFKNSIANAGANKNFPFDLNIRYFYDSDTNGKKKSLEKIDNEKEVFLWEKLKRDLELPDRPKWDLNDLMIYLRNNNVKTPYFENYFSKNKLDAIDI